MTTTTTIEETKIVPQDIKEPVKDAVEPPVETNNKQDNDKKPAAAAEKDEKESAPAEPPAPKFAVKKQNFEKDVVYLYQFSRTPVIPSMSPYCLKVETWLRLVGLKYEVSAYCKLGFISQPNLTQFSSLRSLVPHCPYFPHSATHNFLCAPEGYFYK